MWMRLKSGESLNPTTLKDLSDEVRLIENWGRYRLRRTEALQGSDSQKQHFKIQTEATSERRLRIDARVHTTVRVDASAHVQTS